MTSFNVVIPENKISEFKKYLQSIGAEYSTVDYDLDDEMISELESRLKEPESEYISAEESLKQLKDKYGI